MSHSGWQVHKFGGSSLADAECFRRVADILLCDAAERQAAVVSAMGGMTDALLRLVATAEKAPDEIGAGLEAIAARYRGTVAELLGEGDEATAVLEPFEHDLRDATDVLHAVSLVRAAADRSRDLVAGFGELWSARLLGAFLQHESTARDDGRPATWLDARQVIVVRHGEMGPAVLWDRSRENARREFPSDRTGIVVVTGFIASDPEGLHTTLGRNGSDFSASILAALLEALLGE